MPRRRNEVSKDGSCPHCGSFLSHSKGGNAARGNNLRYWLCLDCGLYFYHGEYSSTTDGTTLSLSKYFFKIPQKTAVPFGINAGDNVCFKQEADGVYFIKDPNSIITVLADGKSLGFQSEMAAENFRFIFDKLGIPLKPITLLLNENQKIMGIVSKQKIKNKLIREVIDVQRESFIGLRRNGTAYFSSELVAVLQVNRGDYVHIYEHNGKVYLTIDIKDHQSGFRLVRQGSEGFSNALGISSTLFTSYFLNRYNIGRGVSFRIYINAHPVKIENYTMFEVIDPEI